MTFKFEEPTTTAIPKFGPVIEIPMKYTEEQITPCCPSIQVVPFEIADSLNRIIELLTEIKALLSPIEINQDCTHVIESINSFK